MVVRENVANRHWGILSRWRNILYGIAAISIIVYHYTSIYSYYPDKQRPIWADIYFTYIGSIGVEIFLFLSGISLYFAYVKKNSICEFLSRRIKRIIIPYLLVGITFWVIEYTFFSKGTVFEFIQDVFFVSFFTAGENRFWYVLAIMVFYMCYPIVYKYILSEGKNNTARFLVSEILIIIMLYLLSKTIFYRRSQMLLTRIPCFLLGCYYGPRVLKKEKINILEKLLISFGIILKVLTANLSMSMLTYRMVSVLYAFSLSMILCLLIERITNCTGKKDRLWSYFGVRSLELYLTNVALIKICIDAKIVAVDWKVYIGIFVVGLFLSMLLERWEKCYLFLKNKCSVFSCNITLVIFVTVLVFRTILNFDLKIITVPSDEFNTVSMAARIMGYDWSGACTSGGYYGYTAVLSYLPIFLFELLFENSYLLYQAILFVNSIICALYAVVLYNILSMLGDDKISNRHKYILTLLSVFLPQLFGVGQLTQNECTYVLNHILVVFCILKCIRAKNKIKQYVWSFTCALFLMLSWAGNNRGVVIIIATCMTIIMVRFLYKKWIVNPWVFSCSLVLLLSIHYLALYPFFKSLCIGEVYNTDASLIFERIPRVLTNWEDLKACLFALIGWVYTFIVSTYGIGLLIIVLLFYFIFAEVKNKGKFCIEEKVINSLLIFWLIGTTILCIIGFLDSFQGILGFNPMVAPNVERADKLFYFRYYLPMAAFGMSYCLFEFERYKFVITEKIVVLATTLFYVVTTLFHGYVSVCINGMSYAPSSTNYIGLFLNAWLENYKYGVINSGRFILCTLIASMVLGTFFVFIKRTEYSKWLGTLLAIEMLTCIIYSGVYMGPRTQVWENYMDSQVIEALKENDIDDVYVTNKGVVFLYQFSLPRLKVSYNFEEQDVIVGDVKKQLMEEIEDLYTWIPLHEDEGVWVKNTIVNQGFAVNYPVDVEK